MRDKKDNATYDLPGFGPASEPAAADLDAPPAQKATTRRARRPAVKQEQLELLEPTDATGLPIWQRDDKLDLTGLPIWAPASA